MLVTTLIHSATRTARKALALGCLLLLPLLFAACEVKEPLAPSWDVDLDVPVLDKKYTLDDVLQKDTSVLRRYTDPAKLGQLYYADSRAITPIVVGDKLKFSPANVSVANKLGTISVTAPAPVNTFIGIKSLFPAAPSSGTVIIPPIAATGVTQKLARIPSFSSATFASGSFNMVFTNNNGVPITIESVAFASAYTNAPIPQMSTTSPLTIPNGQTGTVQFNLAGATLPDSLSLTLSISSSGSGGQLVAISANSGTNISTSFQNFSISQVTATVPQQNPIAINGSFQLDSQSYIKSIIIDQGSLEFTITNGLAVALTTSFTVANLKQPNGSSYTANVTLGAKGQPDATKKLTITSLHDWSIVSATPGLLTNTLAYSATAQPLASSGPVTMRTTDSVSIVEAMSPLVLKSITGKFKPTTLNLGSTSIPIKLGTFSSFTASQLLFDQLKVLPTVNSSPSVELKFAGKVIGKNELRQDSIKIDSVTLDGTPKAINLSSSELTRFINTFATTPPDSLILSYGAILNPNFKEGGIANTDSLYGTNYTEVPIKLGIGGGQFIDTTDLDMSSANRQELDNLREASLNLKIENGIPASVSVSADIYDANWVKVATLPSSAPGNPTEITVSAAGVDATGLVNSPVISTLKVAMTNADFQALTKGKHIVAKVKINTTPPATRPVAFRTTDYIKIYAYGLVNYRVKP